MSIDFRRTHFSPINNSTSKQQFSFSKADRFEPTRISQQVFLKAADVKKKGALQKRATSFGFGHKIAFASQENVPFAGIYTKCNQFQQNKNKNKGYRFRKDQNRSIIDNIQQVTKLPGPGSYISINDQHKTSYGIAFQKISFSIRGKFEDPLLRHKNELGPGQYSQHGSMTQRGQYFNTKYQDSKCRKIGKQSRFQLIKNQTPGPGHYKGQHKINMNGTGTYFNSKYNTIKANKFGLSERPSPSKKNEAPDPGTYHQFSQFSLRNKKFTWKQL